MICEQHSNVERELATHQEQMIQVKFLYTRLCKKIDRIDERIRDMERRFAKWGGVIAGLASIPAIIKAVEWITPLAQAAIE